MRTSSAEMSKDTYKLAAGPLDPKSGGRLNGYMSSPLLFQGIIALRVNPMRPTSRPVHCRIAIFAYYNIGIDSESQGTPEQA